MADSGSGIIYTWSGSKKIYESGELSISPNKVKFADFDNNYAVPVISNIFTPSSHPPGVSLEEGTAMYVARLQNPDIDLNNCLTYTPPDGYELVSEDNKNDTGVKEYLLQKNFYCDPVTVYYGTAAKSFNLHLIGAKWFYYKKVDKLDTYIKYYVTFTLNSGMLNCKCNSVTNIPGTNNGNVTLAIDIELGNGIGGGVSGGRTEVIQFSWVMKDGIDKSKSCSVPYYLGSGFTTQSGWETDNGDGTKTHYTFQINHDSIPSPPNSKSL